MFLTDGDGNIANQFTNGNPGLGQVATQVNADWLNMEQNELKAILDKVGVTPDKSNNAQVIASIMRLIPRCVITVGSGAASFNGDHQGCTAVAIATISGPRSVLNVTIDSGRATSNNWVPIVSSFDPGHARQWSANRLSANVVQITAYDISGSPAFVDFATAAASVSLIVVGF